MRDKSFNMYDNNIKTMSEKELKEKFLEFKSGNLKARNEIIYANINLVKYIAKRYNVENCDLEDVVSIGIIGLIKAVDTYDIKRQIKFSTYAVRCINNEILMNIRKIKRNNIQIVNMYDCITYDSDNNELKYIDIIEDKNSNFVTKMLENSLQYELYNIMNSLSEIEKKLIILYFGFDENKHTQKEIANILGISQSTVSRLIVQILVKFRIKIEDLYLKEDFIKKFITN